MRKQAPNFIDAPFSDFFKRLNSFLSFQISKKKITYFQISRNSNIFFIFKFQKTFPYFQTGKKNYTFKIQNAFVQHQHFHQYLLLFYIHDRLLHRYIFLLLNLQNFLRAYRMFHLPFYQRVSYLSYHNNLILFNN